MASQNSRPKLKSRSALENDRQRQFRQFSGDRLTVTTNIELVFHLTALLNYRVEFVIVYTSWGLIKRCPFNGITRRLHLDFLLAF